MCPAGLGPSASRGRGRGIPRWGVLVPGLLLAAACDSGSVAPPEPRFAQVGELQVEVISSLDGGSGRLEEAFLWRSEGPWVLAERMQYQGLTGDESFRRPELNPGDLAPEYASLVQQLNETPGLRLFAAAVPQDLNPQCLPERSRITVTLRDTFRNEEARWVRCVEGTFFTASPATAGPDPGAARVVTAAQLARFFTLGEAPVSTYFGSRPFYRIDRGESSPAEPSGPLSFRSGDGSVPEEWLEFWEAHAGAGAEPPSVDWDRDMVVLAAAGRRLEAGESVRVRRILPIDQGTRVEMVRRVPGDFCSPAAKEIYPFDLVVAPRGTGAVLFNEPELERIPCGA